MILSQTASLKWYFMCSDYLPLSNEACRELKTDKKSREEKVKNLKNRYRQGLIVK